ncbi:NAD(P)/FAD-dependent oxidoreductase [Leptospira sp. 2 VSF19]|uniref:NAD(P)/FAD-dependent oxidoreductase n=1 Tax=Leptospira soteropolitanensis TaxID=2950025 RepID=A0AAW5VPA8_9LEPT|nr:NAD(P)/FAD-dependent oxidoreductase [Leptospira soteropolitanensis]MCW7493380.1 NAD(P)/FAD-dependent oxidoreductase [Leptospira soteropolitanensis]MCW7501088.1 NAD(P)/FAD-dependent oxidoreductase [Leptospira soteropolitanensis]MCW7523232.1 NAD(P)/FAD-dependent oxidoreductase [Leptospira soteropolitanensis]MCW7527093.1 NAD(P)/FAD-dependent oxidoreductase [Leptospira soteropolitanensis]MCW7530950.1 NAD(P)/FAD-dependent oxidoreductase [Leptospira soteropolitanensis]
MESIQKVEVAIIGGSFSGLSAALSLVRSLRKIIVIDSEKPCNKTTPASHNFLTHDGESPGAIHEKALSDLKKYPNFKLQLGEVTSIKKNEKGYLLKGNGFSQVITDKIIFATGLKDILPEIPGFAESWGKSVIHCPYCHGYEYVGNKTGLWMNEPGILEHSKFLNHWSKELTVYTNGPVQFSEEEQSLLENDGINIVTDLVDALIHKEGQISSIKLKSGNEYQIEALYTRLPMIQHSKLPEEIGCKLLPSGHIEVSNFYETNVPGVYAVGDMASMFRSVANAVHSGNIAGAMLNRAMILS